MKKILPISVVIPCYNCVRTIERALSSVYEQEFLPSEVILVDDKSTDNTLECLNSLKIKYYNLDIKIIPLDTNSGPGTARNIGWDIASAKYVAFLDSDDTWAESKLKTQFKIMNEDKSIYLSCHSSEIKIESPVLNEGEQPPSPLVTELTIAQMFLSNRVSTRSVMVINDRAFKFCDGKKYSEDFLLWMEMILSGKKLVYIHRTLAFSFKRPFGDDGLTGDLWKMQKGQLEAYDILNRKKYISSKFKCFIKAYSLIRFIRRYAISKLY